MPAVLTGGDHPGRRRGGPPARRGQARTRGGRRAHARVGGPRRGCRRRRPGDRRGPGARRGRRPPGGGPVPALRCGLAENRAPWVALLAADLPFLTGSWIAGLWSSAASAGRDGAVFTDAGGRPQWLAGCWRGGAPPPAPPRGRGQSLGGVLDTLRPVL